MCCCHNVCKTIKVLSIINFIIFISILIFFLIVIINNGNMNKDILVVVARSDDNTQVGNAIINFGENQINEGTALSHQEGTSQININESGI